jgi:hypothetical protein
LLELLQESHNEFRPSVIRNFCEKRTFKKLPS